MRIEEYIDLQFKETVVKEKSFRYKVNDMEIVSYLYIKPNTNRLFVMLNGALTNEKRGLPIYHRYTWHSLFNGSVLYVADPTLLKYKELSLAWYLGDKFTYLMPYLRQLVISIAKQLGLDTHQIITYGSSGGGFASLQLASEIGGNALSVCINPQTNILNYEPKVDFLSQCFGCLCNEQKPLNQNSRFNAILNVQINNTKVLFIQNEFDVFHVQNHFQPFVKALNVQYDLSDKIDENNQSRIQVYWYKDEKTGHGPETKEMLPHIMDYVEHMLKIK